MAEAMVPVDDPGYIYLTRKPAVVHEARRTEPKRNVGCKLYGQLLLEDKSTSIHEYVTYEYKNMLEMWLNKLHDSDWPLGREPAWRKALRRNKDTSSEKLMFKEPDTAWVSGSLWEGRGRWELEAGWLPELGLWLLRCTAVSLKLISQLMTWQASGCV